MTKSLSPLSASTLRTLRRDRGWSQDELSRRAGVGRSTIGRIEGGKRHPELRTCAALVAALATPDVD